MVASTQNIAAALAGGLPAPRSPLKDLRIEYSISRLMTSLHHDSTGTLNRSGKFSAFCARWRHPRRGGGRCLPEETWTTFIFLCASTWQCPRYTATVFRCGFVAGCIWFCIGGVLVWLSLLVGMVRRMRGGGYRRVKANLSPQLSVHVAAA